LLSPLRTLSRKFDTEVDRFQQQLKIQKAIFRNQCRLLLENVTEPNVATRMLLGGSREACCIIVRLIDEKLRDIGKESQDLGAIVDASNAVSKNFFRDLVPN